MNVKKLLSVLLTVLMVVSLVPVSSFAQITQPTTDSVTNGFYLPSGTWTYGGTGSITYSDAKLQLTKTAATTATQGEFEITLGVTATVTESTVRNLNAAAVLVIDTSSSMSYKDSCDAAISFLDQFRAGGAAHRYVAIVTFNDGAYAAHFGIAGSWVDITNEFGYAAAVGAIREMSWDSGATNLDAGLAKAKDVLASSEIKSIPAAYRFVTVVTDGTPTKSAHYGNGSSGSSKVNSETANTAKALREVATVATICVKSLSDKCYRDGPTVGEFLGKQIATEEKLCFEAKNINALKAAYGSIIDRIKTVIVNGFSGEGMKVTDTMGVGVTVVSAPEAFVEQTPGHYVWTLGKVTPSIRKSGETTVSTYTYTLKYTVALDASAEDYNEDLFHPANGKTVISWNDGKEYEFPVPGLKTPATRCVVTFNAGSGTLEGQDGNGNVVYTLKKWSKTPAAPKAIAPAGYFFFGWSPALVETVTGDVTYVAQFKQKGLITLSGNNDEVYFNGDEQTAEGYQVSGLPEGYVIESGVSYKDAAGTTVGEYFGSFDGSDPVITLDGEDVTERFDFKYVPGKISIAPVGGTIVIVRGTKEAHEYNGTSWTVTGYSIESDNTLYNQNLASNVEFTGTASVSGTYVGDYPMGLDKDQFTNKNDGFADVTFVVYDGELSIYKVDGEIVITADSDTKTYDGEALENDGFTYTGKICEGDKLEATVEGSITNAGNTANEVTSYKVMRGDKDVTDCYNFGDSVDGELTVSPRSVTLTSDDAKNTYNGKPLTAENVKVTGQGFVDGEGADFSDFASITNAGSTSNTFEYTLKDGTLASNYTITPVYGTLTVDPIDGVVVTITEHGTGDTPYTYNGQPRSIKGYDFLASDALYTEECVSFNGDATVTATNANTYGMGLKAGDFENISTNFTNVTFVIVDGYMVINPATVTLTSATDEKKYDGVPFSAESVDAVGFIGDEGATYNNFAVITGTGTVDNTFTYVLKEGTVASNYVITPVYGKLTVIPDARFSDGDCTGYTGVYDGTAHDAIATLKISNTPAETEWTYEYSLDNVHFTTEMPTVTHVGNTTVYIRATSDQGEVLTTAVNAAITPATITLTADDLTKVEGKADPALTYTVTGGVNGETPAFSGTLTRLPGEDKGSYRITAGTIALADGEGFLASDYTLVVKEGTLRILHPEVAITSSIDKKIAAVGDTVTFTVTIKNTGEVDLNNLRLVDTLIGVNETIDSLAVGEEKTFTFTYVVTEEQAGKEIVNNFTIVPAEGEPMAAATTTTVVTVTPVTGDTMNMTLWFVMIGISMAVLSVAIWRKKVNEQ